MSALLEALGIDSDELAKLNPDHVEQDVESGGVVPEGKYHAMIVGVGDREAKETGNSGAELEFEILTGPYKGAHVKDTIWKSEKQKGKNRALLFAHRLGLLTTTVVNGVKQYAPVEGKTGWADVFGTQCIIDVTIEEYDQKDKSGQKTGKKGKSNRLEFAGVYRLDDPKVKDVPRAGGTVAPPTTNAAGGRNGAAPVGQAARTDDYASLGI